MEDEHYASYAAANALTSEPARADEIRDLFERLNDFGVLAAEFFSTAIHVYEGPAKDFYAFRDNALEIVQESAIALRALDDYEKVVEHSAEHGETPE